MSSSGIVWIEDPYCELGEINTSGECDCWFFFGCVLKEYFPDAYVFYDKLTQVNKHGMYEGKLSPDESEKFFGELEKIGSDKFLKKLNYLLRKIMIFSKQKQIQIIVII